MDLRVAGETDQSVYVYITEDVGGTSPGEPKTGLTHSNITSIYYTREGGTPTTIGTLSTLAAANSAHADGGFKEVDGTNAPGLYRVDPPDAAFATGAACVVFHVLVAGASNAVCSPLKVGIIDVDLRDSVRAGLTALPNAAADAAGGLPISDAGGLDMDTLLGYLTAAVATASALATAQADLDTITGSDGATLASAQANYAPAKAGDSMALTSGERATLAGVIWNSLTSGMTTAGSIGKKLADWTIHSAADVWAVATRVLTANTNLNDPTAAAIADAVWTETLADHSGSSGSTAEALNAAGAAGDPWTTALPGAYGAGSAGNIVGNLNDVSSADVQTAAAAALTAYDPPTRAEATSDKDAILTRLGSPADTDIATDIGNLNDLSSSDAQTAAAAALTAYDPPTKAELDSGLAGLNDPTAAAIAAAILAAGDVDGYSVEETLRGVLAACCAKLSGAATTTVTIRAADDSKDRITATVDADGNRSAITLDLSA